MSVPLTGGCQCGAIRFCVAGEVRHTSLCHCRMCQKATGGLFGVFTSVRNAELTWTRGAPAHFRSSTVARRGFCKDCGTPLTFEWNDTQAAITFGAFDHPETFDIDFELARDSRLPCVARLMTLSERPVASSPEEEAAYARMQNFQHPDHDTAQWPEPRRNP